MVTCCFTYENGLVKQINGQIYRVMLRWPHRQTRKMPTNSNCWISVRLQSVFVRWSFSSLTCLVEFGGVVESLTNECVLQQTETF